MRNGFTAPAPPKAENVLHLQNTAKKVVAVLASDGIPIVLHDLVFEKAKKLIEANTIPYMPKDDFIKVDDISVIIGNDTSPND